MGIPIGQLTDKVQQQVRLQTKALLQRRNKFNMRGNGRSSGQELTYAQHLEMLEAAGKIRDLKRQVRVDLPGFKRYMIVDFRYFDERLCETVWDEYKGFPTPEWQLKRDIWAAGFGPGLYRITHRTHGEYVSTDIRPRPRQALIDLLTPTTYPAP